MASLWKLIFTYKQQIYSCDLNITKNLRRLKCRYPSDQVYNGINKAPLDDRLLKFQENFSSRIVQRSENFHPDFLLITRRFHNPTHKFSNTSARLLDTFKDKNYCVSDFLEDSLTYTPTKRTKGTHQLSYLPKP